MSAQIIDQNSILDRVMAASEAQELSSFNPVETVNTLFRDLGVREQDVLRRRFGLHASTGETLEKIGAHYNVTRERIRQIENAAIRNIRGTAYFAESVKPVELVVLATLERHGGIMAEDHLLEYLLESTGSGKEAKNHILFLVDKLISTQIVRELKEGYHPSWRVEFVDWKMVEKTIAEIISILDSHKEPLPHEHLLDKFRSTQTFADHKAHYGFDESTMEPVAAHLRMTRRVKPNSFGEWGLSHWNTVTPKRMGDKIYLVMRKHGQPLHFRDIANRINEANFDKKKAYPPTVHNELILDERYVLVGRGIYALAEWGYIPGVVSDVIVGILRESGRPLSREEIVEEVMKQRLVKKGTIHLALANPAKFTRDDSGRYGLAARPAV